MEHDYEKLAESIVELMGGLSNIDTVSHARCGLRAHLDVLDTEGRPVGEWRETVVPSDLVACATS